MEGGRDGAQGRGDDGLVEGNEEDGEAEGCDDESQLEAVGVVGVVFILVLGRWRGGILLCLLIVLDRFWLLEWILCGSLLSVSVRGRC